MKLLKRKIDRYLLDWKNNPKRKPLIVKGARQIGKTESIRAFAKANYESVIEINFVLLIQRGDQPFKGGWAFPGGFMNMDETTEQCAIRELEEETGLRLSSNFTKKQ